MGETKDTRLINRSAHIPSLDLGMASACSTGTVPTTGLGGAPNLQVPAAAERGLTMDRLLGAWEVSSAPAVVTTKKRNTFTVPTAAGQDFYAAPAAGQFSFVFGWFSFSRI